VGAFKKFDLPARLRKTEAPFGPGCGRTGWMEGSDDLEYLAPAAERLDSVRRHSLGAIAQLGERLLAKPAGRKAEGTPAATEMAGYTTILGNPACRCMRMS
jgi:hypothetical protein